MKDYQERVVHEKTVLDGKISRLEAFVAGDAFQRLPIDEQERLNRQVGIMNAYSEVLRDRIDHF